MELGWTHATAFVKIISPTNFLPMITTSDWHVLCLRCVVLTLSVLNSVVMYVYIYMIYICKRTAFFTKIYFVKKRSYSKCCWSIQLVYILKLFSLYKCFLAYFSISKKKHAFSYATDAFIAPYSYKQIGCCFYGLTSCSVCCKN